MCRHAGGRMPLAAGMRLGSGPPLTIKSMNTLTVMALRPPGLAEQQD